MTLGFSTDLRNARADAITTAAGTSALLRIYDGVRPATGGAATTQLAVLTGDGTAFAPAAAGGVLSPNAFADDTDADNSGEATWFRLETSGGTFVMDGDVGGTGSGADLEIDNVNIVAGGTVSLTSPRTFTEGNA